VRPIGPGQASFITTAIPAGKLLPVTQQNLGKWSYWPARRRIHGWFGATLWRAPRFWTAKELAAMVKDADLTAGPVRGAVFFQPGLRSPV